MCYAFPANFGVGMRFPRTCVRSAGIFVWLSAAVRLFPQSLPEIEKIASQVAVEVERSHAKQILIAPQEGCLLSPSLCEQFESNLRNAVVGANPRAQFVSRNDLLTIVKNHGLASLDVYDKHVLTNLASDAGADALVAENISWQADHYELQTRLYALKTGEGKKRIVTKVLPSISGDDPLVYRDPEGGASLIVPKRKTGGFRLFRYPECTYCRMPDQSRPSGPQREPVSLLMTVTDKGQMEQIVVVESSSQKAAAQTLEAVKGWRFKPAIDSDGNPFSARILVTVDLTLPLCPAALSERGEPPRVHIGPPDAFQPCPVLPRTNYPAQF